MILLPIILGAATFVVIGALPIFNLDRASEKALSDKRTYLDAIETLQEDGRIEPETYTALHLEQASVSFLEHRFRRETFRDPMTLYPLLRSHTAL